MYGFSLNQITCFVSFKILYIFKNLLKLSYYKNGVSKSFFSLQSSRIIKINNKKNLQNLTLTKGIKEHGEYFAKIIALKQMLMNFKCCQSGKSLVICVPQYTSVSI